MGNPHIVAIPYPAQGHVIPVIELGLSLAKHGIKVTIINSEFDHNRINNDENNVHGLVNLVSIPDGLEPHEDRNDGGKLSEAILRVMPGELESLIHEINESDDDKICCVVADLAMGWALNVARRMGIRRAAFFPAAAASLALHFSIPKLIEDGIIDNDGKLLRNQMIQLSPAMPPMHTANFTWTCMHDANTIRNMFDMLSRSNEWVKESEWLLCNSASELEPAAFSLFPNILPIGPLLAINRLGKSCGYYWPEKKGCLEWLNQQRPRSVIYVAFGSFTFFDEIQFQELASALEFTNRPFLWVVRQYTVDETGHAYPKGFRDRINIQGKIVSWAPQQQVLSHPSIACFVSHCGWNSTIEGVSNGVPFLCWPYFTDQFFNKTYICDVWKIGLAFNRDDETGLISKGEFKSKVDQLLSDLSFKERALDFQEKCLNSVKEGGCSNKNFSNFIRWIKTEL